MAFLKALPQWVLVFGLPFLMVGCNKDGKSDGAKGAIQGLTSVSHLNEKTVMATINDAPVTVKKFDRTFAQRLKMMKIKREDISEIEQRLMETGTFESLVSRTILLQEAVKQGFQVDAESLATAKNEILKTLPEGMTPQLFMSDMGISMKTFEEEVREDMLIAMLQESVARAGRVSFDELITQLESQAKVKVLHAPGGGDFNKIQSAQDIKRPVQPKPKSPSATPEKHWRDQSKDLRRKKAKAAGLKPWEEGYPE